MTPVPAAFPTATASPERGSPTTRVGVACVVVAFHRPDSLDGLLDRLVGADLEVVVVNVESDLAVRDVARRRGAAIVDLVGNPGYGAAVNRGVAASAGEVVVFMNDDAWMAPAEVRRLAASVAEGRADVTVPLVMDGSGNVERTIAALPTPRTLAREWLLLPDRPVAWLDERVRVEKWRSPAGPERIDAAAAVAVACSRTVLLAEPLPEDYFLYWEESEWFWRLRARGAVVEYRPDVTCVHAGGRDDVRPEKSRLLARNAVRCVRRTQGRLAGGSAFGVVVAWNGRLVLADALRAVRRPSSARWARLRARWAGFASAWAAWREIR